MAFDKTSGKIICGLGTTNAYTEIFVFDPATGLKTAMQDLAADTTLTSPQSTAVKAGTCMRASIRTLESRTRTGTLFGTRDYPNGNIRGITASPLIWTFVDQNTDEIVVIGSFGNEIATTPTPPVLRVASMILLPTLCSRRRKKHGSG